ncbi:MULTISPECIES: ribokinase [unclassified Pseudobutyrivibrio]|uniref:ribokinase n=1 Tax=unclassified Pseudobutyrivibrio TaxID=2638619 RepID=UPI0005D1465A|nr:MULTISPECIES: ribokinase [unclassified Pseudobutyrivibrio]SES77426.1 ribokinase [Pseudobutyrivibrio sp. C4]
MKVLNFGSLNLDYTYQVPHIVREGETISSNDVQMHLGGKGFNQSVALARAGVPVYHAGLVGEEGLDFYDACQECGIKTDYIKTVTGRCGHTIIQVDDAGQNSIVLFGGANQKNTKEYVDEVLKNFETGDILLLQNEVNELPYIIDQAFAKGMTIVLNPSPMNEIIDECDLGKVSIFVLNETEGQQLTGQTTPSTIVAAMEASFANAKIVLTLGKGGSIFHHGDEELYQAAFDVDTVDTTAAGDTFTGYLIAGILKKQPMRDVLVNASKAAALAVKKQGAAQSIPFMSEVELFNM